MLVVPSTRLEGNKKKTEEGHGRKKNRISAISDTERGLRPPQLSTQLAKDGQSGSKRRDSFLGSLTDM